MTFDGSLFIMSFVMFRHVNFSPSFLVICIHSKHYKTGNVHLIMCVLYETTIERIIGPKNNDLILTPIFCPFELLFLNFF
jgi:hypothetical protein